MTDEEQPKSHCNTVRTIDDREPSNAIEYLLKFCIVVYLISSLVLCGTSVHAVTRCKKPPTQYYYAGILVILNGIFFAVTFLSMMAIQCEQRFLAVVFGLVTFILSSLMVINETLSLVCTREDLYKSTVGICYDFRELTNWCDFVRVSPSPNSVLPDGREILDQVFVFLVLGLVVTIIILCTNILYLVILGCAWKLGQPVYLVHKRHKTSVVVGKIGNADLAFQNRKNNLVVTNNREDEQAWYADRRASIVEKHKSKRRTRLVSGKQIEQLANKKLSMASSKRKISPQQSVTESAVISNEEPGSVQMLRSAKMVSQKSISKVV